MGRLIDGDKLKLHYAWWGSVDRETSEIMTYPEMKEIVDTIIDLQPTIEAEPIKHGRWIREPNCWYRCYVCGEHYPSVSGDMKYNYCPNCGTFMNEVKE